MLVVVVVQVVLAQAMLFLMVLAVFPEAITTDTLLAVTEIMQ
jgi:hypothetical protein